MHARVAGLLLLALAGAARGQTEALPSFRVTPGVGLGLITASLELNFEGPRWYAGGQGALAWAGRSGIASYLGLRGGVCVTDSPASMFVGAGAGSLHATGVDSNSWEGWGASAEVGLAWRRNRDWFHAQAVVQIIFPFAQRSTSVYPPERSVVGFVGARLFL
jgi:hypothetical protein